MSVYRTVNIHCCNTKTGRHKKSVQKNIQIKNVKSFIVIHPYDNFDILVKGTVRVIRSDPLCKDGTARSTTVPLKPDQV